MYHRQALAELVDEGCWCTGAEARAPLEGAPVGRDVRGRAYAVGASGPAEPRAPPARATGATRAVCPKVTPAILAGEVPCVADPAGRCDGLKDNLRDAMRADQGAATATLPATTPVAHVGPRVAATLVVKARGGKLVALTQTRALRGPAPPPTAHGAPPARLAGGPSADTLRVAVSSP